MAAQLQRQRGHCVARCRATTSLLQQLTDEVVKRLLDPQAHLIGKQHLWETLDVGVEGVHSSATARLHCPQSRQCPHRRGTESAAVTHTGGRLSVAQGIFAHPCGLHCANETDPRHHLRNLGNLLRTHESWLQRPLSDGVQPSLSQRADFAHSRSWALGALPAHLEGMISALPCRRCGPGIPCAAGCSMSSGKGVPAAEAASTEIAAQNVRGSRTGR